MRNSTPACGDWRGAGLSASRRVSLGPQMFQGGVRKVTKDPHFTVSLGKSSFQTCRANSPPGVISPINH